jgi:hypothetical protein
MVGYRYFYYCMGCGGGGGGVCGLVMTTRRWLFANAVEAAELAVLIALIIYLLTFCTYYERSCN